MGFGGMLFGNEIELKQDEIISGKIFMKFERLLMTTDSEETVVKGINELFEQWASDKDKHNLIKSIYDRLKKRFDYIDKKYPFILPSNIQTTQRYC